MSDFKQDEFNDVVIEDGDLALVTEKDAIAQHLKNRLNTFLGEWFLDKRVGVPYFEHILKKNIDPLVIDSVFKREIINTQGIIEIKTFNLDLDPTLRELALTFTASSIEGDITFSEVVPTF